MSILGDIVSPHLSSLAFAGFGRPSWCSKPSFQAGIPTSPASDP